MSQERNASGLSKLGVLAIALMTAFGLAPIASAGASTADAAPSQGGDPGGQMHAQAADEEADGDNVTIRVMKHSCNPQHIRNIDDFTSVDLNGDGENGFVDKVIACPTVVMPGDEYADGAFAFDEKQDFGFSVEGDDGEVQTVEDATFEQRQVCESEEASQDDDAITTVTGADVSGDGDLDDCLDTSLYRYDGVANGSVSVTETDSPGVTGPGALEFTPQPLGPNNDADTLEEDLREVFDDDTIELDTTQDDDGNVVLHVYNFVECAGLTASAEPGPQNELAWSDIDGADSYHVYRATADGDFEQIATVDADETSFDDADVEEEVTYRYQVAAMVNGEESRPCDTAEVTAIPVFSSAIALTSAAVLSVGAYAVTRRRN